jgi:hypothetical protein
MLVNINQPTFPILIQIDEIYMLTVATPVSRIGKFCLCQYAYLQCNTSGTTLNHETKLGVLLDTQQEITGKRLNFTAPTLLTQSTSETAILENIVTKYFFSTTEIIPQSQPCTNIVSSM